MTAAIVPIKREKVQVTGPQMILIFWIARLALEDRMCYDYVAKELNIKGDEAARIYDAIRDFLGDEDERPAKE